MNLVRIKCTFCGKEFFREKGRYNEAEKFNWNQYCSKECQNTAKVTRIKKACGNPDCNNIVSRVLNQFKKSKTGLIFCSCSCAAIVNNKICLKGHAKIKPELKTCVKCGKRFRKNTGNKKYCSIQCRKKAEGHTPEEIIDIIRNVTQRLGRIPARRELRGIDSACRKLFGSWNNAIVTAGFQPNRSHNQRMYKCANAKALDGHLCDSISELIIDDWLTKNNIFHEKDVFYPETNYKTDWVISSGGQKIFVEYFGLANDSPRYDRSIKEKKKLCYKNKISLIAIYPQDLYPKEFLEKNLKNKFRKFLIA